ncbi:hypothetical protein PHAVU_009G241400 [Phaseolus vulgaris]|uniref:Uncharacterized protein n=1 Tax=Phaseolus vulgaris TaxID=3885 RepID=V7AZU9_PHAVU|nr:hypothetical protein PHAVU_009G241400g [Phaseolus vulgaris]ESW10830.1 hypothetical protein PHAVU_009G241400g [Phaseolus vulgaris]
MRIQSCNFKNDEGPKACMHYSLFKFENRHHRRAIAPPNFCKIGLGSATGHHIAWLHVLAFRIIKHQANATV